MLVHWYGIKGIKALVRGAVTVGKWNQKMWFTEDRNNVKSLQAIVKHFEH